MLESADWRLKKTKDRTVSSADVRDITRRPTRGSAGSHKQLPLRLARDIRLAALDGIRAQDWFKITHIDGDTDAESWRYMQSRRDKDYSVVDCSSFVLMQRHGLNHALTSDKHFEQAGFVRLLK